MHEQTVLILRHRGEDKIGESDREYRQAEEESVDYRLRLFICLSFGHPPTNDFSAHVAGFHVAASLLPQRVRALPVA